jgi:hypothetical protein
MKRVRPHRVWLVGLVIAATLSSWPFGSMEQPADGHATLVAAGGTRTHNVTRVVVRRGDISERTAHSGIPAVGGILAADAAVLELAPAIRNTAQRFSTVTCVRGSASCPYQANPPPASA